MMSYSELLNTKEWSDRRNEIVDRDKNKCQSCQNHSYLENRISMFSIVSNYERISLKTNTDIEHVIETYVTRNEHLSIKKNPDDIILAIYDINNNSGKLLGLVTTKLKISEVEIDEYFEKEINGILKSYILRHMEGKIPSQKTSEAILTFLRLTHKYNRIHAKSSIYEAYIKSRTDLLNLEWHNMRNLHVHHKYYQNNKMPWEYPDSALITLCWKCHENEHKKTKILWLNEEGKHIGKLTSCSRCFGAGVFPEYHHIQSGVCFRCGGAKYDELFS